MDGQDRERLELERAGWERLEHEGEAVWRNPVRRPRLPSGHSDFDATGRGGPERAFWSGRRGVMDAHNNRRTGF